MKDRTTLLIALLAIQVANPDPNARIHVAMQWTCRHEK